MNNHHLLGSLGSDAAKVVFSLKRELELIIKLGRLLDEGGCSKHDVVLLVELGALVVFASLLLKVDKRLVYYYLNLLKFKVACKLS